MRNPTLDVVAALALLSLMGLHAYVGRISAAQHGLVTRAQLLRAGVTRRQIDHGGWGGIAPTAAALWRLDGFPQGPIELTVGPDRQPAPGGVTIHRAKELPPRALVERIPVTRPDRTLLHLAAVVEGFEIAEQVGARRGIRELRAAIESRTPGVVPGSVLESRMSEMLRKAGLPEPLAQYRITYPERKVVIEGDGYRYHSGRAP